MSVEKSERPTGEALEDAVSEAVIELSERGCQRGY